MASAKKLVSAAKRTVNQFATGATGRTVKQLRNRKNTAMRSEVARTMRNTRRRYGMGSALSTRRGISGWYK